MPLANFIVIGAPKAGTTAVYRYFAEHPQVFMSPVKETNFFAYARDAAGNLRYGDPVLHRFRIRSESEYQHLFRNAGKARAIGEASPIYLECPDSAQRIRDALPDARLICGLRDPVDRAYSDYLMYLRGQGRRLDPRSDLAEDADWARAESHWVRTSRYHEALQRYFELFPRERIHVFLFDDLKRDPQGTMASMYAFLGVDASYRPDFSTPYNVGGVPSRLWLERACTAGAVAWNNVEPWLPKRFSRWVRRARTANMQKPPRLPDALRRTLAEHFRDDLAQTSQLIGRDLRGWLPAA